MTIEQLRKAQQTTPFQPYTLHLASGRELRVASSEFVALSPGGRTISVAVGEDAFEVVDLLLLETISLGNGRQSSRRRSG